MRKQWGQTNQNLQMLNLCLWTTGQREGAYLHEIGRGATEKGGSGKGRMSLHLDGETKAPGKYPVSS